jgi:hypothetical protein
LPVEQRVLRITRFQEAQIVNVCNLGVSGEVRRNPRRIVSRGPHAQRQGFHRAHDHPRGVRVKLRAQRAAQRPNRFERGDRTNDAAGDQIGMAADILGQRIHHDIGAVLQWL